MPRLMSVALTTEQVRNRTKTVTRRAGWQMLAPGDLLTLCPKVRGRRHGEPLERIITVEVVSIRREPLAAITGDDVIAEGFPEMTPAEFVDFFCTTHTGVTPTTQITRIEWAYPRLCRECGCTDHTACDTLTGPCSWHTAYHDNTGLCTACTTTSQPRGRMTP
ncbi:hypothetical protein [Gordonia sp. SMJS1]|uniref:hypothetical protein n=1 Tax=Gordonia sp. SMJS1 TaxID=3039400 RepID=UPI0024569A66|nr:hypothetical protein [Gordonia sp. SMJS1]WGJ88226.1 hypothetical protein QAD21_24915 [Gordonia sp. SMJS1]